MKRTSAFILALLFCLTFSFTVFADDIFIIEDGEDAFVADAQTTTTQPAETTTAASGYEDLIDPDKLGSYFDSFKDMFGDGIDSIIDGFDSWGNQGETTTAVSSSTTLPRVDAGEYTPVTQYSSMTTLPSGETTTSSGAEQNTGDTVNKQEEELPSVLVVNDSGDDSWGISGSTLTLIVFIAAIVILVLVVIIVLILMTRRTEFDSAVKNRSTLPGVDKPDSLALFIEADDDSDDGDDYSNITYWEDE